MWALIASSVGVGPSPDDPPGFDTNDAAVYARNPYAALPASFAPSAR